MSSNQKLTHVIAGRTVKDVRQADITLIIDFEDGSTMTIQTQGPTSSVIVRDKDNVMEYAD